MRILLVDNYDSFTYNLVHYLEKLGADVHVLRNDNPELLSLSLDPYNAVVLSPGPGLPAQSGHLMKVIERTYGRLPMLGVCLGMQALALHCGAQLYNRSGVMHGRTAQLEVMAQGRILDGVADLQVGLYHSWAVKPSTLDQGWKLCAVALDDAAPMVMEHEANRAYAVQFHPESILTPGGLKMLENWLKLI